MNFDKILSDTLEYTSNIQLQVSDLREQIQLTKRNLVLSTYNILYSRLLALEDYKAAQLLTEVMDDIKKTLN